MATLWEMTFFSLSTKSWNSLGSSTFRGPDTEGIKLVAISTIGKYQYLQDNRTSCKDSESRQNSCRGDSVGNPFLLDEEGSGDQEGRRDENTADGLGGERAAVDGLAFARVLLNNHVYTSY